MELQRNYTLLLNYSEDIEIIAFFNSHSEEILKMALLENVKKFFTKDINDYDLSTLNMYEYHPQLRSMLIVNGIFFNENSNSKLRFLWPGLTVSMALVATGLEIMFVYHGIDIKDYSFATENFVYFMILSTIPVVYTSVLLNVDKIKDRLGVMNEEFAYICKLGDRYRVPFLAGQNLIYQLCLAWMLFSTSIAVLFVVMTLLYLAFQTLFATQDEHLTRPLIFPIWLPEDDPFRSPNYEIFMIFEMFICFFIVQTFCVYVYILFHILLHYYNLMAMIILDLEVIFEGLDEEVAWLPADHPLRIEAQRTLNKRFERIVKWHLSVFKSISTVSSVYGPPLVYQVMFSATALCLMMYHLAEQLDEGRIHLPFAMLTAAACVQLWIPCYLGTLIRNRAFGLGDCCFTSGWHETSLTRLIRSDIILFILRTQQSVSIKFTGLPDLQLETFSSVMSSAYSYFNMLRQYSAQMDKQ